MPLATRIKLFLVVAATLILAQVWLAPPNVFLTLAVLSLLFFSIAKLLLHLCKGKEAPQRGILAMLHPGHGPLFLWLPLLLFCLFARLILIPEPMTAPENWYKERPSNSWQKFYAKARIQTVFKPGTYLAEFQLLPLKKRGSKHPATSKATKAARIPVYLQVNDYYLLSGCHIWLKFTGWGPPQKLPQGSFGNYLRSKGAVSLLRLSRRHLYRKDCRNLDLRGKFQDLLGRVLYKSGFSLYQRGMALGLLLGRSGYMQKGLKNKAVELGILHLFAASGLHMGIFYLWFYWPLSLWLGKKNKLALSLPLIPCFFYMFFLGFPISLVRAFTFLVFHALQSFIYRKINSHDLLLNSAIVILFLLPESFLSLGTFLSFGAVSGIFYFYPILWRELSRLKVPLLRPCLQQATISICASLFTIPILLYAFQGYSYASLIANVILVPFVGILMPVLVGGIGLSLISGGTILFFAKIAREATEYFISLTQWLSNFSYYIRYDSLACLPLVANIILILSLLGLRHHNNSKNEMSRTRPLLVACVLLCILLLSPVSGVFEKYRKQHSESQNQKPGSSAVQIHKK